MCFACPLLQTKPNYSIFFVAFGSRNQFSPFKSETSFSKCHGTCGVCGGFPLSPLNWMLSCTQLVRRPSEGTSMSKYVASQKRQHNPRVWCWRGLIAFVALWIHCESGGLWVFPLETWEGHQESTAAVILNPSSASPSPVIDDWIRDNDSHRDPLQEGGDYADMVEEPQIHPSLWWLTIRCDEGCNSSWEETRSAAALIQYIISSPFPLTVTITHHVEEEICRGK